MGDELRHIRSVLALAILATTAAALTACSFGPARDADGRVTETTQINSSLLEVGDCFTLIDGTSMATVTPCDLEHTLIVFDDGELDATTIAAAGGLQNAVNAACDGPFAEFKAAAADGVKPEQQFLVSEFERDGATLTKYSCVATDAAGAAAAG